MNFLRRAAKIKIISKMGVSGKSTVYRKFIGIYTYTLIIQYAYISLALCNMVIHDFTAQTPQDSHFYSI